MVNSFRLPSDDLSLSDAGQTVTHTAFGYESLELTDAGEEQWLFADGIEILSLTDSVVVELTRGASPTDTLTMTDTITIELHKAITDDLTMQDNVLTNASWSVSILDDVGLTDVGQFSSISEEITDDLLWYDTDLDAIRRGLELYGRWLQGQVVIPGVELYGVWQGGEVLPLAIQLYETDEEASLLLEPEEE